MTGNHGDEIIAIVNWRFWTYWPCAFFFFGQIQTCDV